MNELRKNIVYIGGFTLPDGNAAAQRVVANAKLLKELGYSAILIGLSTDYSNVGKRFQYDNLICVNLRYPKNKLDWFKYLTDYRQYIPFFNEFDPKLIIAYNHPAVALERLTNYCKDCGVKIVSDCTEWYEPHGGWLFRMIKGWDTHKRMYDIHCRVDGVIAISKYLFDFYAKRGVHVLQLPPLVDKKERKWELVSRKEDDIIRLVFAGCVGKGFKDRIDMIIDALISFADQCPNRYEIEIVGITENQFRSVYLEWKDKELPSFIHFYGRIEHQKVIQLLLNADFQIFIRDNSLVNTAGFPTKFAETISANTLVLTNASSNITDYLQEGINGFLLDNSNKEALIKSLQIPLSLKKDEIKQLRRVMDGNMFDYRRYVERMKLFIEAL